MEIQLTTEQVLALSPDASSTAAAKKQSNTKFWSNLGMSAEALWGECKGSALYQVKIELASLSSHCSCPSRKFPCKHALGLLLLTANGSGSVPVAEPPEWVTSWLAKRQASQTRKQERATQQSEKAAPSAAQQKAADKRLANVKKGLDGLDLWLSDLMRQGLASVSTQPAKFWEHQAARLRDAQAGGLDARVRRLVAIPNASPDWPEKLLGELGKLQLLTHAFQQEDQLEPGLRETVRQLIGWNLSQEEVNARGETVQDDWLVLGQIVEELDRNKVQRTWLTGLRSGRTALILQFSYAGQPFAEQFLTGSHQEAQLTFWPGAQPQRAQMRSRAGELASFTGQFPGVETIDACLDAVAESLGHQPWEEHFLCLLRAVTPVCYDDGKVWFVRDGHGHALPLAGHDHWQLLAYAGGHPVGLAAEWNGEHLRPLAVMAEERYLPLERTN